MLLWNKLNKPISFIPPNSPNSRIIFFLFKPYLKTRCLKSPYTIYFITHDNGNKRINVINMTNKSVKNMKEFKQVTFIVKRVIRLVKKWCAICWSQHNLIIYFTHTWYKIFCNHPSIPGFENHAELLKNISEFVILKICNFILWHPEYSNIFLFWK